MSTVKISQRKVTREEFAEALNFAVKTTNEFHPGTRLAVLCDKFLELNKKESKAHNKKIKELTADLYLELNLFKAEKCTVKEDKLCKDKDGNYQYNTDGEKAVLKKQEEIGKKIEEVVDEFLSEDILVKCLPVEVKLPEKTEYETRQALNGFAYKNPEDSEFIFEEEPEEKQTA